MKKVMHVILGILLSVILTAPYAADDVPLEDKLEMLENRMWSVINSTEPESVKEFAELLEAIEETKLAIANRDKRSKQTTSVASGSTPTATTEPVVVLPDPHKRIIVDKKKYMMYVYKDGKEINTQRVIVGKKGRSTPSFTSIITHVVLNPYWNVSPNIATRDLAPIFHTNPKRLIAQGYQVYDGWTHESPELDPLVIDWTQFSPGKRRVPYMIRQKPGPYNVLGKIKFIVQATAPSNRGIFLHGTQDHKLFNTKIREYSSGCVRVEDDVKLAKILLNGDSKYTEQEIQRRIDTGRTKWLKLYKPVEVVIN